jgi:hypothetical protein
MKEILERKNKKSLDDDMDDGDREAKFDKKYLMYPILRS